MTRHVIESKINACDVTLIVMKYHIFTASLEMSVYIYSKDVFIILHTMICTKSLLQQKKLMEANLPSSNLSTLV